jgi:short-subunit dehydrogenase
VPHRNVWKSKVVLVTGGSAGLGLEIARAFGRAGTRIAIVGRDLARLESSKSQLKQEKVECITISADVCTDEGANRAVAETKSFFGGIDVLVNNVGVSMRGRAIDITPEDFQKLWEANFLSAVRMTRAASKHLIECKGSIVNIGSLASKVGSPHVGAYAATKFPLAAYSQQLRLEMANDGIHVLLVCPGPIRREDAGARYETQAANLPASAQAPGGGVKLKGLEPAYVAGQIVRACASRKKELVLPWKARILFAISQLSAEWGDWLILKMMK